MISPKKHRKLTKRIDFKTYVNYTLFSLEDFYCDFHIGNDIRQAQRIIHNSSKRENSDKKDEILIILGVNQRLCLQCIDTSILICHNNWAIGHSKK